jgi:ABC-type proline/glycine betaine transport system ATPase subunit
MSDTIYSEPGKVAYSEFDNAPTGLIGTVGYQIIAKSDDSIVQVRTTSDIVEAPTLSGRYKAKFLAPDDEGAYTILWDVGEIGPETTATDDLFVTGNLAALIEGEEGKILSLAEYKTRRQLTEVSLERDDAIRAALASAEDAILQYTGRDFTTAQAEEIREFPWEIHTTILETDDFVGKPSKISFEAPGVGGATAFPTSA